MDNVDGILDKQQIAVWDISCSSAGTHCWGPYCVQELSSQRSVILSTPKSFPSDIRKRYPTCIAASLPNRDVRSDSDGWQRFGKVINDLLGIAASGWTGSHY